jgi:hypothetical protein
VAYTVIGLLDGIGLIAKKRLLPPPPKKKKKEIYGLILF